MQDYYLGMDIGGSNVRIALADNSLNIIDTVYKVPFERYDTNEEEVEKNICSLIRKILSRNKTDIRKIKAAGISLAAIFDRQNGDIINWPNNKSWNGLPLRSYLQNKFNIPFIFEDDANSAALGEYNYGSAKGYNSVAYITISTGIGCGLILDGQLYTGAHGWAGEIGHTKVVGNAIGCKCGATGCLQAIASGPALLFRAKELACSYGFSSCDEICNLKIVVDYAEKGESWALEVFNEAGGYLADAITNIIMLLDIPLVVIGGGVVAAGAILTAPLEKALKLNLESRDRVVDVKKAMCGDDSGVLGVVALAHNIVNSNKELVTRL